MGEISDPLMSSSSVPWSVMSPAWTSTSPSGTWLVRSSLCVSDTDDADATGCGRGRARKGRTLFHRQQRGVPLHGVQLNEAYSLCQRFDPGSRPAWRRESESVWRTSSSSRHQVGHHLQRFGAGQHLAVAIAFICPESSSMKRH